MSLYKTQTINHLNVTDERVCKPIPPYFTLLILSNKLNYTSKGEKIKKINQWIYLNLDSRYGIDKRIVLTNEKINTRSKSQNSDAFDLIWYLEWFVGFEKPAEASFFALTCDLLNPKS